ncbi:cytochrome c oxidase [Desmospora sp. 8437]|nr:cytochrome c oxidase [Desmospora sp. 8437]
MDPFLQHDFPEVLGLGDDHAGQEQEADQVGQGIRAFMVSERSQTSLISCMAPTNTTRTKKIR